MAAKKRSWARLPKKPTPLNRRIPTPAVVWNAAFPGMFLTKGGLYVPTTQVNPLPIVSDAGQAVQWTDGADATTGIFTTQRQLVSDNGITVLIVARPTAEATRRIAFSNKASGEFTPGYTVGFNTGSNIGSESGSVSIYSRNSPGAFSHNTRATSQIDGQTHAWVISSSSVTASGAIHRDGIQQTLATNDLLNAGTFGSAADITMVGNQYASDFNCRFPYPLFLVVAWPSVLPIPLQQKISARAKLLYDPPRSRIWAPAGAAGGSTGTVAYTNVNDTSSASGTTTVIGTLARTNANDTSTANGTTTIVGTLARTNADDSCVASGSVGSPVSGTLATTNANDTSAASGTTAVIGTLARTNVNDTSAASGATTVLGTLARTNANDTSAASGTTTVTGSVAVTNAADACVASGSTGNGSSGTVAVTNALDTSAASGTTTVVGTSATTNASDTSAASGTTTVAGTFARTNANDTSAASGWAGTITGTLATSNANDTSVASGFLGVPGTAQTGAGRPRRSRVRPYVVEIDGNDFIVESEAEALELLESLRATAQEKAQVVTQRAKQAVNRPKRKVLADARKALEIPSVVVSANLQEASKAVLADIEAMFRDAMRAVEIGAIIRTVEDQDEEDILMLLL